MTIAQTLLLDFDPEIANTRRTLERIPETDPQWKPHEKSMPIGRLALHVARLPEFCTRILSTDELNMAKEKFPDLTFQSTAHLLTELERTAGEAKSLLAAASDDDLKKSWKLSFGDRVIVDEPRMVLYRTMFLNHMVHHRAQLGVYLRLLGIPVPGLFGPSADEPFTA
ncbi:MAG: DinB family protein [Acidobacteriaceae bacterium]|nr:DinB family protein [Acidobacteriaceae bacterium]